MKRKTEEKRGIMEEKKRRPDKLKDCPNTLKRIRSQKDSTKSGHPPHPLSLNLRWPLLFFFYLVIAKPSELMPVEEQITPMKQEAPGSIARSSPQNLKKEEKYAKIS